MKHIKVVYDRILPFSPQSVTVAPPSSWILEGSSCSEGVLTCCCHQLLLAGMLWWLGILSAVQTPQDEAAQCDCQRIIAYKFQIKS